MFNRFINVQITVFYDRNLNNRVRQNHQNVQMSKCPIWTFGKSPKQNNPLSPHLYGEVGRVVMDCFARNDGKTGRTLRQAGCRLRETFFYVTY